MRPPLSAPNHAGHGCAVLARDPPTWPLIADKRLQEIERGIGSCEPGRRRGRFDCEEPAVLLAPLRHPVPSSPERMGSQFKASLSATLELLDREIWHLTDTRSQRESAELLIAIRAGSGLWRMDGRPRAHAVPEHPGVIFSLDSKHGPLSYPCDTFTT